ncbi:hypothetical protein [Williamsia sp. 1138]|uniref:hypothetical protein n=1 Tax=Williamsia sp. 1138 TaxID=1903117 RepID=UPI000A11D7FB|nr:hypothetical protein [Williamsia sp. 1138]
MGLSWADWIRFVLAPLILASIAAIVATRNAKKTPHERLKNLVDIHEKIPDGLDSRKVVEAAIARELVDFDRRVAADQRGFWAGVQERFVQVGGTNATLGMSALALIPLTIGVVTIARNDSWSVFPALIINFALTISIVFGGFAAFRAERKSLKLDRVAAHIDATFPRAAIQHLASQDVLAQDFPENFNDAVARLRAMGVFESDDSSTGLRVTPFGKHAIRKSLRIADRRYFANLADIEAERAAREDEPGREAPGQ